MWDKRIMRLLTIAYIVEGAVAVFAPESMNKFTRWFVENPRNMRLGGLVAIALGIWLALKQVQEERPPQPWNYRWFKG